MRSPPPRVGEPVRVCKRRDKAQRAPATRSEPTDGAITFVMSEDSEAARAKADATFRALVVELAKIAAAEDDAAERRRDIATA